MLVEPITSEHQYDRALAEIEQYFDKEPAPGTPEAEHFDALHAAIEVYEATRWPINARGSGQAAASHQ